MGMIANQNATVYGPTHKRTGNIGYKLSLPVFRKALSWLGEVHPENPLALRLGTEFREKINRGEPVYLAGFHSGTHNTGVALVEATKDKGVRLITNNEEERYTGIKHYTGFPEKSIDVLLDQMSDLNLEQGQIHAFVGGFDHGNFLATSVKSILEELPKSVSLLRKDAWSSSTETDNILGPLTMVRELRKKFTRSGDLSVIGMNHHGNHAYFSYAVSPFALTDEPTMITVIDGTGDDSSISTYLAKGKEIRRIYTNFNFNDSLGNFYRFLSSTQGGWSPLSSEGRYMGAAAWGDQNRKTNRFYDPLRGLLSFERNGEVLLNRSLANWARQGWIKPYSRQLEELIGPPIELDKLWDPDLILRIDIAENEAVDQERVDKAAAIQMIFEDALLHIVDHLIRVTGSKNLVLSGGTALNCAANSLLLEHFNEEYYQRHLGLKDTRLHIWIPPTPSDQGSIIGAPYQFALVNGAPLGEPFQHAFYCGKTPATKEIRKALESSPDIGSMHLGNIHLDHASMQDIPDLLAYIISQNGVLGLYQGRAETGPRALGHRSILANPCNRRTLETLNKRIKFREVFRPLAPMATLEAARKWFELSEGASDNDYNAYNYMVFTARAKRESFDIIPAVIHKDGTSRVQIVRQETDPFTYAFLKSMGRRLGVEVAVNTSLNVGSPIVQTPDQALDTLRKAKGMDGIFMISQEGDVYVAWHNIIDQYKDCGTRLKDWIEEWKQGTT